MIVNTTHAPGTFCWPELSTTDQAAAEKFYGTLFGWSVAKTEMGPDAHYTIFQLDGNPAAAAAKQDPEQKKMGIPPNWLSYVSTPDVDASIEKVKKLGGNIMAGPFDVMEHGRMAVATDPTGAVFALWQAKQHPGVGVLDENNSLVWTELYTDDAKKAGAFYQELFGWTGEDFPGNANYTVLKRGDAMAGGMMEKTPDMKDVPNHWTVYYGVADLDAAVAKIQSLGGKLMHGPMEVEGVGRMAFVTDPQGANFAVLQFAEKPKG